MVSQVLSVAGHAESRLERPEGYMVAAEWAPATVEFFDCLVNFSVFLAVRKSG